MPESPLSDDFAVKLPVAVIASNTGNINLYVLIVLFIVCCFPVFLAYESYDPSNSAKIMKAIKTDTNWSVFLLCYKTYTISGEYP